MCVEAFRKATEADAEAIVRLVNRSYLPESPAAGWTHESDFVAGERVSIGQVEAALADPNVAVLLGLKADREVVTCVQVEKKGTSCHIGMLAVHPPLQGLGIGKEMLTFAEHYGREIFEAERLVMSVLSARRRLIAFCLRRGYRSTGILEDYLGTGRAGMPKRPGLVVEQLEKMPPELGNFSERAAGGTVA